MSRKLLTKHIRHLHQRPFPSIVVLVLGCQSKFIDLSIENVLPIARIVFCCTRWMPINEAFGFFFFHFCSFKL